MLSDERAPRSRSALFSSSPLAALVTVVDTFSGNPVDGLTITDTDTAITLPSLCGGQSFVLGVNPDNFQASAGIAADCVTGLSWNYQLGPATPLSIGPGNIPTTSLPLTWLDSIAGLAGQQWQTVDPNRGARVGLASGSPVASDGAFNVYPLGAGNSLYVYTRALSSPDSVSTITFQANANTDNELRYEFRRADANNLIALAYNEAIPAFVILQRIGGVQTILGTQSFDLTTLGPTGATFVITAAGANITIASADGILVGTFVTTVLSTGQFAFFFNANGAGASGFSSATQTLRVDP